MRTPTGVAEVEGTRHAPAAAPGSRVCESRRSSPRELRRAVAAAGLLAFAFCGSDGRSPGTAAATPPPPAVCPPADGLSYVLPYPPPGSFLCSQGYVGYSGPYPHSSVFRYALDSTCRSEPW